MGSHQPTPISVSNKSRMYFLPFPAKFIFITLLTVVYSKTSDVCDFTKSDLKNCDTKIKSPTYLVHNITSFTNVNITCEIDTGLADGTNRSCLYVPQGGFALITGSRITGNKKSGCIHVSGIVFLQNSVISSCGRRHTPNEHPGLEYPSAVAAVTVRGSDSKLASINSVFKDNVVAAINVQGEMPIEGTKEAHNQVDLRKMTGSAVTIQNSLVKNNQ